MAFKMIAIWDNIARADQALGIAGSSPRFANNDQYVRERRLRLINGRLMAVAAMASALAAPVQASSFTFSGDIAYHNDVVSIDFLLGADASNVKVWTDSFESATNFDPITAVWRQTGADWTLVGENDDNPDIAPGQTYYDSGLTFDSLAAGSYKFTIATYPNFANGSLLSQGFALDGEQAIALANWYQPASHYNMGTFYRVHLSGVDSAVNVTPSAVPEPETYAMLLTGIGLLGAVARRRKQQAAA